MKLKHCLLLIVSFSILSVAASAEDDKTHSHNHQAHVHGLATLTLVLENKAMEIKLASPAINLLGFEHRAHSPQEIKQVETVETLLKSPEQLFLMNGTECAVDKISVDTSAVIDEEHEHHAHSEADDSAHEYDEHSEITAYYHYNCEKADDLLEITTRLFEHFPAMETINAMWVTDTQQGAETLNMKQTTIQLR